MSRPDPARLFAALGDPLRLELLGRLARVEALPLGRLVEGLGVTRQGASKHLAVLEQAGLVRAEKQGREKLFSLAPDALTEAQGHLARLERGWEDALARLKRHVE
ncbi:MAG: helix-turn-helix transcriptional regulator [Vannielia sp.]|uniref:ArsR/SmtB family transcription factor n=1 Tax=Vannielia sp. TaxID=2813045 RepID=UPI003B8CE666